MSSADLVGINLIIYGFYAFVLIVLVVTFFNISANIRSLRRHFVSDKDMKAQKKKGGEL